MEINSKALSLFDYIGNQTKASEDLQSIAQSAAKDYKSELTTLNSGLANSDFEDTLKLLESGEISLDLATVENYFQFNQNKLDKEIEQLTGSYGSVSDIQISIEGDALVVSGDDKTAQQIQAYLDRDSRLSSLVQQTSKLSQFVEWGKAKEQAGIYQEEGMPEETLVDYLKEARTVVTDTNELVLTNQGSYYRSNGHTASLNKHYSESDS